MRGPKIMVFHIRQLLKAGGLVLGGLILILALIWILSPKDKEPRGVSAALDGLDIGWDMEAALFVPGVYESYIILDNKALRVSVTVDDEVIKDVALDGLDESQATLYPLILPAMRSISESIVAGQTTDVDVPAEWRLTGGLLLEAINLALNQAYAHVVTTGL